MKEYEPDLVLIEWEHNAQPMPAWNWLEGNDWDDVVYCQSVGWLIHDDDHVKALAPNKAEFGDKWQVSGVLRIPTRSVIKITNI